MEGQTDANNCFTFLANVVTNYTNICAVYTIKLLQKKLNYYQHQHIPIHVLVCVTECLLHIPRSQKMDLVSSTFLALFPPSALEASSLQRLSQLSSCLGLASVLVDL